MLFEKRNIQGTLVRRYKRFIADIELLSGNIVQAHCPNTGSMKSILVPGGDVLLSESDNPERKFRYTWELARVNGVWAGINTMIPNLVVEEAVLNGEFPGIEHFDNIRREVPYGVRSRVDLLVEQNGKKLYIEVKNVTLVEEGRALFPDSVTARGTKHLRELMKMKEQGHRAIMVYFVHREDAHVFSPAVEIDPLYAETLKEACRAGIEIIPLLTKVTPQETSITGTLPYEL